MKDVVYTADAARALRRHGNVARRIRKAVLEYAANPLAHANNVTRLVGAGGCLRMRVGDYRVIFEETPNRILVLTIGPRGGVYVEGD